MQVLTKQSFPF